MGLKRVMFMTEVVFPQDDPRTLDELSVDVTTAVTNGVLDGTAGGAVTRLTIMSAAQDPDPEDGFTPEPPPTED